MSTPLHDWAARAATLPAALVAATPRAVGAGAQVLEQAARTNLSTATGGDLRLSRVRSGKGARVNVKVSLAGAGSNTRALVLPTGPVSLVEGDTRAHVEPFRYLAARTGGARSYSMNRRRKAARRGFLYLPGIGFRQFVRHRGTRGKHPVRNAFRSHAAEAGRSGTLQFATAARRHMAG